MTFFQNFEDREHGRIVIYITTLGILRATWARCVKVRQILRNLLIRVDERDVFMTKENQLELMDRMGTDQVILPQVFIDGQLFGVSFICVVHLQGDDTPSTEGIVAWRVISKQILK
jgi:glutaredoxin